MREARLDPPPRFLEIYVLLSLITSVKLFTNSSYLIQMSFLGHNSRVNQLNQRINLNNRICAIRADLPETLSVTPLSDDGRHSNAIQLCRDG